MSNALIKAINGVDILFDDATNQFHATVGGKTIRRRNIRELEKALAGMERPRKLLIASYSAYRSPHYKANLVPVTGVARNQWRGAAGGVMTLSYEDATYGPDPELVVRLKDIVQRAGAAEMALYREWQEALRGVEEIKPTPEAFAALPESPEDEASP